MPIDNLLHFFYLYDMNTQDGPPAQETRISVTQEEISLGDKLETLPAVPGVYQFKNADGRVLYVGKAVNLRSRVRQYFQRSRSAGPRIDAMVARATDLEIIVTSSEVEALILEATLIKKLKPRYNVDLKDDKTFPFIVITNEPFPRVFVTRRVIRDGSRYFGPFTDVKPMRASLKMIREIFKVRSCNFRIDDESIRNRKIRVCLDYHIKKCEGPCEGIVSAEHYNGMINEVALVLKGKTASLVDALQAQMERAAGDLRFEEAASLRDKVRQLSVYNERQKVVDAEAIDRDIFGIAREQDDACGVLFKVRDGKFVGRQHVYMSGVEQREYREVLQHFIERYYLEAEDIPGEVFIPEEIDDGPTIEEWLTGRADRNVKLIAPKIGEKAKLVAMCQSNAKYLLDELSLQRLKRKDFVPHAVKALERDLRLGAAPRRIECFDISNIQGTDSVGSMVVFVDGKPKKSEYRKYKIQSVEGPDDFASMREVIDRRYSKLVEEQGRLPDLIVVDGGKGQLSSALEVLQRLGLRGQSEGIPIIGLAKRLEEIFVPGSPDPQSVPRTSSGLKLLQQIRDEAHRFAVTYHRTLRKKRTLQTELDLIKGVGKKRARELLEAFGSVQGVKFATEEQLAELVGEKVAGRIKDYFHEEEEPETG